MKKVKIYGAGSIGNHLSRAFRTINYEVFICDTDKEALVRMKNEIYPSRYGDWDNKINLYLLNEIPKIEYDFVVIGTPPDSHTNLALESISDGNKNILIEKPLSFFGDSKIEILKTKIEETESQVFVGYNHVVSKSIQYLGKLIEDNKLGDVITIDVEFRENWDGIFKAHPWLDGPHESYLGFIKKGGGALSEHSHALNLWQHLALKSKFGQIKEVFPIFKFNRNNGLDYDEIAMISLKTDQNNIGRVIQDVITTPHKKTARIICEDGTIEWVCNFNKNSDRIIINKKTGEQELIDFKKTREQDFLEEVKYINKCIEGNNRTNDISFEKGYMTMKLIDKCFMNEFG